MGEFKDWLLKQEAGMVGTAGSMPPGKDPAVANATQQVTQAMEKNPDNAIDTGKQKALELVKQGQLPMSKLGDVMPGDSSAQDKTDGMKKKMKQMMDKMKKKMKKGK